MPFDNNPAPHLETRLRREFRGELLFDAFSRGRYSTDASIYQIEPLGVVAPRGREDAAVAIAIAREEGVPILPRGAGTSQCGQTVARALVLDCSKHMDRVISVDVEGSTGKNNLCCLSGGSSSIDSTARSDSTNCSSRSIPRRRAGRRSAA
jgi:hypothetical protein